MADSEDLYDLDSMEDEEIRDLILQEIREDPTLDPEAFEVDVAGGSVTLSGRVGTEEELEAIESIVVDRIGVADLENDIVVDETARLETDEAADEAVVDSDRIETERHPRGEDGEPSAAHLREDVEGDLYGTQDMQKAIEQGESYNPPARPRQEGTRSRETH